MSRIVVFLSHGGSTAVLGDLARDHDVTLVGPVGDAVDVALSVPKVPTPLQSAVAIAWRSAAGRNLVRITPFDPSRRLWRAARRDGRVADLVRRADVVIAADRDAIFSVWKLSRRRGLGSWSAVFGATAARFVLGDAN